MRVSLVNATVILNKPRVKSSTPTGVGDRGVDQAFSMPGYHL